MKIFFTLLIISVSVSIFAQTNIGKHTRDNNGAPLKNDFAITSGLRNPNETITSINVYDSIRPLDEINDVQYADAYPWLSSDALRLYYTNGANNELMFTHRADVNSYFVTPVILPVSVVSAISCWLTPDELEIYISDGNSLYYANRADTSQAFGTATTLSLTGINLVFISGASLNFSQNELFIYNATNNNNILQYRRTSATSFDFVRFLTLPGGYTPRPGQLSKDDLTYFFGASYNGYEPQISQLTRATPIDSFDVNTFQQVLHLNNSATVVNNLQPSMSANMDWVAFVRSPTNIWSDNNLYISYNGTVTSVFNPEETPSTIVFPNPSNGKFIVQTKNLKSEFEVYNLLGEKILQQTSNEIDISNAPRGIYFVKIFCGENVKTKKIIVE